MANYQEARVKLTNTQLNKLKFAAKNKTGTIRLNKKNFEDEELPHKLFLTIRQTTKIRNAFSNNISTDIKLSKAQISKIIQSGGSFGCWLGNLRKKTLTNITIPLARDNLPGLVGNITSSAINKFDRKIIGKGAVTAGKGFTLFISNEDMNIIKIITSLEDLGVLIDGVAETVKDEIKKHKGGFLGALLTISITHNIFRIQDNESIMCGFYCIAFIEYMLAAKTFLDYINLFSPNDYKKNDKIIYKYFQDKHGRRSKY